MHAPRAASVIPFLLLVVVLVAVALVQPRALTFSGMSLILVGAIPVVLATMSQLFVMATGDIDLGIGTFVGLVNVVVATSLASNPVFGVLALAGLVVAYVLVGVLIYVRRIPSIVVTFGMASIWLGIALIVMPTPGGEVPLALMEVVNFSPPVVPLPVILFVVLAVGGYLLLQRTALGVRLRAVGADPASARRAGVSVLRARIVLYAIAGIIGVFAGIALAASTGSGDANGASALVLPTVAAVIVGGGAFTGGRVDAPGAVAAAVAISLISTLMAFLNVPAAYSSAVEGLILLGAVGLRALTGDDVGIRLPWRKRIGEVSA